MDKNNIATLVKSRRLGKGLTQQEVADLAGISLRSFQRIEKAEVTPRMYTLKDLSSVLDFDFHNIPETSNENSMAGKLTDMQRKIISIGIGLFSVFVMLSYMAQSSTFPETSFETLMSFSILTIAYSGFLLWLWRNR